jgi:hypothetical protein
MAAGQVGEHPVLSLRIPPDFCGGSVGARDPYRLRTSAAQRDQVPLEQERPLDTGGSGSVGLDVPAGRDNQPRPT